MSEEWDKRKEEIEEQECSDYFADPENQPLSKASLIKAITAALYLHGQYHKSGSGIRVEIINPNECLPESK